MVADVLTKDQEDHLFRDIAGVIRDALEIAGNEDDFHGSLDDGGVRLHQPQKFFEVFLTLMPGTRYLGLMAAMAYKQLEGRRFERVIVLGCSHYADFDGACISDAAYQTPSGTVPLSALADTLAEICCSHTTRNAAVWCGHRGRVGRNES